MPQTMNRSGWQLGSVAQRSSLSVSQKDSTRTWSHL